MGTPVDVRQAAGRGEREGFCFVSAACELAGIRMLPDASCKQILSKMNVREVGCPEKSGLRFITKMFSPRSVL